MPKPDWIDLPRGVSMQVLYEDHNVLAFDKPAGWMLAPDHWEHTSRNLQQFFHDSIRAGEHWTRSRNLRFLRYVHRLDADTSGALLTVRSPGAMPPFSELFAAGAVAKAYLAIARGKPSWPRASCHHPLAPAEGKPARMRVGGPHAKPAVTDFVCVASNATLSLFLAFPLTGRTHQIRVHLQKLGHPVQGDRLYGGDLENRPAAFPLALRSWRLGYRDPFDHRSVIVRAPSAPFLKAFGFGHIEESQLEAIAREHAAIGARHTQPVDDPPHIPGRWHSPSTGSPANRRPLAERSPRSGPRGSNARPRRPRRP